MTSPEPEPQPDLDELLHVVRVLLYDVAETVPGDLGTRAGAVRLDVVRAIQNRGGHP